MTILRPFTLIALVTLSCFILALPVSAATFSVTEPDCLTSPGGYQWAIEQANNTPGRDTISIDVPVFSVDRCDRPDSSSSLPIAITESVDIVGNGNTVNGDVQWINSNGFVNPAGTCPDKNGLWLNRGGALLDVGIFGVDSSGIEVTVDGLNMYRLTNVGVVRENAALTISDAKLEEISSIVSCARPILEAEKGADVTLERTEIFRASVPTTTLPSTQFPLVTYLIGGRNGDLVLEDVTILDTFGRLAAAVSWDGGSVKVVNSLFLESRGFWLQDSTMDFVNSVFQTPSLKLSFFSENIILGQGSVLTSKASTFYWGSVGCTNCNVTSGSGSSEVKGLGFVGYPNNAYPLPSVRFESTALGSVFAGEMLQKLWGDPAVFSSDSYTWVQPTAGQDAAELAAILPNASTTTPGLTIQLGANFNVAQTPIIPGELVEAVPDADPGGINQLISPIDGLPITEDINGNPRVYANGTRNIGAVQNSDAPNLTASPDDAEVILAWSPTQAGQSAGYETCTSPTLLTDPLTGACPGASTTVGATVTSETISGLTNGSPYWFAVRDLAGIWSKVATATPMGQLGITQPTGVTAGDGSLQVFWAEPTLGGHTGLLSYSLVYRPVGTQSWLQGAQSISAQTTLLTGLINGTTYEIGLMAQTDDGGQSSQLGTITGTPQAAPTLSYANPGTWPQNTPLTLNPSVTQLQGTGTYSITSGSLPTVMNLNPSTGVITGTPTTQQSTTATIRLTDGTTGLFAEYSVPLDIVAPSPSPQLWYPAIQATVGIGPVSAKPTQANFGGVPTYSVVAGENLPAGFGIDASTGVISGIPTSAPGQVLSIDIQACWGGCDPNAGEVRIAPMLFYILPGMQYPANTNATAGVAVSITPTVDLWSGGQFSLIAGSMPAGMSLNTTTGVISGPPQTVGNYPLTIRYSTGVNVTTPPLEYVTSSTQIDVDSPTIELTYPEVSGTVGKPLSVSPTVSGLTGATIYAVVTGSLPQGLSLNAASGTISGTPTSGAGTYPVVIEVTDSYGSQRTSVVITLSGPISIPTLNEWGMLIFSLILAVIVFLRLRRRDRMGVR